MFVAHRKSSACSLVIPHRNLSREAVRIVAPGSTLGSGDSLRATTNHTQVHEIETRTTTRQSRDTTAATNPGQDDIVIAHNLNPAAFKWLWAKYVTRPNLTRHCQACLRSAAIRPEHGRPSIFSCVFSKARNPTMKATSKLVMNEQPPGSFAAIYLCGVSTRGYSKTNYPHNLHTAIIPVPGATDVFQFETWRFSVTNGLFTRIPTADELSAEHRKLPHSFTSCRIFRWAACILPELLEPGQPRLPDLLLNHR